MTLNTLEAAPSATIKIIERKRQPRVAWALEQVGIHPLLARLLAARGVSCSADANTDLHHLLPPDALLGIDAACDLLMQARVAQTPLCVVADYDCDGATACAVAVRGLQILGFDAVDYLVPDRMLDGYGLTPAIAERVAMRGARLLVTVDNGIASVEGVARAKALGLQVLITDHHLPAATLPQADAIVNPNQPGCNFPSKNLAGVGVVFYVLLALRARLRQSGEYDAVKQPRLDNLLPLVALGTVADVVPLDANNRRLVAQGLKRIRKNAMPSGIRALFQITKRAFANANTFDLGFALGPRINAAGRLQDMRLGIACLLTDETATALTLARQLDEINKERRTVEEHMQAQALQLTEKQLLAPNKPLPLAIAVYNSDFHEGVVGIVASRLKERWQRPVFVFAPSKAPGQAQLLKGSGRSVPGLHLRDALDLLSKRHPDILLRFGGHAMAAGCTIDKENFNHFQNAWIQVAHEILGHEVSQQSLQSDGALEPQYGCAEIAQLLEEQVWGQGFAPPVFSETMQVQAQRLVGEGKHLALTVEHSSGLVNAIWFGRSVPVPKTAKLAYQISLNTWQGQQNVQFRIQGVEYQNVPTDPPNLLTITTENHTPYENCKKQI